MSEMKCEVIQDLITLYIDDLSCDESNKIIENHIENCNDCKYFLEMLKSDEINIDIVNENKNVVDKVEKDLIDSIKKSIINKNLAFALIGAVIAVAFTVDMFIFNAIFILPTIGAIVYLVTRKLWIAPITVGIFKTLLEFMRIITQKDMLKATTIFEIIQGAAMIGFIFLIMTGIGVLIGVLIKEIFLEDGKK